MLVCGVRHLVSYVRAEINRPRAPISNFQISPPLWSEKKIKPIKYHGAKKGGYAKRTAGLPGIAAVSASWLARSERPWRRPKGMMQAGTMWLLR